MRKKWGLSFLLLLLFVTACAKSGNTEVEGNNNAAVVTEQPAATQEPVQEPTTEPTKEPTATPTPTEIVTPTPLPTVAPLKDVYAENFKIGVALNPNTIGASYQSEILTHFNSVTCENEMKTDAVLDQANSKAGVYEDPAYVAVKFDRSKKIMEFCEENDLQIRYHTLVWHNQTPEWFFHEDYDVNKDYVDIETMKLRMKNFIYQVIEYYDTEHPDLIYTIDVVNEAFNGKGKYSTTHEKNGWYETMGHEYVYYAFLYAREAIDASENMKDVTLVYNDYSMMYKVDNVISSLPAMFEEHGKDVHDYVDAIGMQSHLSTNDSMQNFLKAAQKFVNAGYELQITELDIGISDNKVGQEPTEKQWQTQAKKYRYIMDGLLDIQANGGNITSVTVWGISDNNSWRGNDNGYDARALLYARGMVEKPALRGMALCPDIPSYYKIGLMY